MHQPAPGSKSDVPDGPIDLKERHRAAEVERLDTQSPSHKVPAEDLPAAPPADTSSAASN